MHLTKQKEEFSKAFVHALATVAGFRVIRCDVDDDSIDIGLKGNRSQGTRRKSPHLDIQLKCTELDNGAGETLPFTLKMKNYEDLREVDRHVPAILVVLCVPVDLADWLRETPEETAMRRVAYWRSLRGEPQVKNETKKTVHLSRNNLFTVDTLKSIMKKIGDGGLP